MTYGIFEAASTDGLEQDNSRREASRSLEAAIHDAKGRYGSFLGDATSKQDFDDRLALVKPDLMKTVEAHLMPVTGVMRRVSRALRPDFKAARKTSRTKRAYDDAPAQFSEGDKVYWVNGNGSVQEDEQATVVQVDENDDETLVWIRWPSGEEEETTPYGLRHAGVDDAKELVPEGNFDSYLDHVDQNSEKVKKNFTPADHKASMELVADIQDAISNFTAKRRTAGWENEGSGSYTYYDGGENYGGYYSDGDQYRWVLLDADGNEWAEGSTGSEDEAKYRVEYAQDGETPYDDDGSSSYYGKRKSGSVESQAENASKKGSRKQAGDVDWNGLGVDTDAAPRDDGSPTGAWASPDGGVNVQLDANGFQAQVVGVADNNWTWTVSGQANGNGTGTTNWDAMLQAEAFIAQSGGVVARRKKAAGDTRLLEEYQRWAVEHGNWRPSTGEPFDDAPVNAADVHNFVVDYGYGSGSSQEAALMDFYHEYYENLPPKGARKRVATGFSPEELEDMKSWAYAFGFVSDTMIDTLSPEDTIAIIKKEFPGGLVSWQQANAGLLSDVEPAPVGAF